MTEHWYLSCFFVGKCLFDSKQRFEGTAVFGMLLVSQNKISFVKPETFRISSFKLYFKFYLKYILYNLKVLCLLTSLKDQVELREK